MSTFILHLNSTILDLQLIMIIQFGGDILFFLLTSCHLIRSQCKINNFKLRFKAPRVIDNKRLLPLITHSLSMA
jgi:hypothetical protein